MFERKSKMEGTEFNNFKWMNESKLINEGNRLITEAPGESDFFCNNGAIDQEGITPETLTNASFFYTEGLKNVCSKLSMEKDK